MAKCPKCQAEIGRLMWSGTQVQMGSYERASNGTCYVDEDPVAHEMQSEEFFCPECGDQIFDCQDDAENFLSEAKKKAA